MPLFLIGILGGTLIASAIKGLFDVGMTGLANHYNRPQGQIRRLRKAGLPLAYMYQGRVATQSETPKLSIEPTLGTLPKLQGDKAEAETTGKNIENQKNQGELDWLKSEVTNPDGFKATNQVHNLSAEREQKYLETFITKYEKDLKKIELDLENNAFAEGIQIDQKRQALKKAVQQVKNLLAQEGLMGQLQRIRGLEEQLNQSLTEDLESMDDWASSLAKILLIISKRR